MVRTMQRNLYFGQLEQVEKRLKLNDEGNGCFMETVVQRADEWGWDREMVGYVWYPSRCWAPRY